MKLPHQKHGRRPDQSATPVEVMEKREIDMGSLDDSIGYRMRRAQIAIFQDIISAFAEADIRPAQFSVMVLIGQNPGLNQSEVAAALGIKRANFVALIDSLEARGLAKREPTATDRRSYALQLTEAGQSLLDDLQRVQAEHEARIVARIGAENRAMLLELLEAIAAGSDSDQIEDA